MTIIFDSITLPNLKLYPETFAVQTLAQSTERSLDGTLHEWTRNEPGYAASLTGEFDRGITTKAILDALHALSTIAEATYTLDYHGTEYSVSFRFNDPPVIYAEQIAMMSPEESADRYNNLEIKIWIKG